MRCLPDKVLQAYIDGEIEESDASGLIRHLKACPACRDRLAQSRSASELVKARLSRLDPARTPAAPPLPEISRRPAPISPFWRRLSASRIPAPAAALAMTGLFVIGVTIGAVLRGPSRVQEDRRPRGGTESTQISLLAGDSIQVLPVSLDLRDYVPLEHPAIFTIKE
jgi:anti-sigma factor RsiW